MIEDVSRHGRFVKVVRVDESTTRERVRRYPNDASAEAAYRELMFSKEARERFLRQGTRRKP